ncbi:hypothetical protein HNQ04_003221 [Deinococcus radiopugnans ATCC 19172]|uniref:Transposase n=1 Tax=Deinococcus radiopugnans ATCC 19172 TaxID=585398 RepID=A0ABR6NXR3_9DEIO|nr:hypothetical protein [Deinococcus radiopugnans ATCC 19172]
MDRLAVEARGAGWGLETINPHRRATKKDRKEAAFHASFLSFA